MDPSFRICMDPGQLQQDGVSCALFCTAYTVDHLRRPGDVGTELNVDLPYLEAFAAVASPSVDVINPYRALLIECVAPNITWIWKTINARIAGAALDCWSLCEGFFISFQFVSRRGGPAVCFMPCFKPSEIHLWESGSSWIESDFQSSIPPRHILVGNHKEHTLHFH